MRDVKAVRGYVYVYIMCAEICEEGNQQPCSPARLQHIVIKFTKSSRAHQRNIAASVIVIWRLGETRDGDMSLEAEL